MQESKNLEVKTDTLFQKIGRIIVLPLTALVVYTAISLNPSYEANLAAARQTEKLTKI